MSYAQNIFTTTSPNETNFVITWTAPYYMTTADVKAEVDKVAWTVVSVSGTNVTLATGIPTDSTVRIYRETDVSSNEVDFLAGSPFRAGDVNLNFDQTLFAIQEALTSDENHEADIDRLEGLIDTILALLNNNIQFVQVANVAALDTAAATDPENLKGYEVTDSTGLEGANPEIPLLPPKAGTGTGEDPVTGVYWDSGISTKVLWDKANQNWIYVSYFASNGDNRYQQITIQQATAPVLADFKNGTLWFNTTDQNLYLLYDDSSTRSWVLVNPLRDDRYVNRTGDSMTGNLLMNNADVVFEGSTDDGFETTLTVTDPTADNSIVLPDVSGNVVTTGDTGTVTSTMIADGTIVDADVNASAAIGLSKLATGALPTAITVTSANIVDDTIVDADINSSAAIGLSKLATGALPTGITVASANIVDGSIVDADINSSAAITLTKLGSGALPSNITVNSDNITNLSIVNDDVNANAEIEVSKLANGTARQLLQTDAAGTGVEFTSNVDVPGTLDVTSTAVFDSNVGIGDTSPDRKLQVVHSTDALMRLGRSDASSHGSTDVEIKFAKNYYSNAVFEAASHRFEIQGTEKMRIDSSGNVGIGTTSPTSYANSQKTLVIQDNGSPAIAWSDTGQARDWFAVAQGSGLFFNYGDGGGSGSASNVTNVLTLDNSGNVGIGTSSVDFSDFGSNTGGIAIEDVGGTNTGLKIGDGSNNNYLIAAGNGSFYQSHYGSGSMIFGVGSGTGTERMRILSNGNIGIGTTAPTALLHVTNSSGGGSLSVGGNGATQYQYINFGSGTSGQKGWQIGRAATTATFAPAGGFCIYDTENSLTRLGIDSSGLVGIGMTPDTAASSTYMLQLYNPGNQCFLSIGNGNTGGGSNNGIIIGNDGSTAYVWNREAQPIKFGTSDTEKAKISSSGLFHAANNGSFYGDVNPGFHSFTQSGVAQWIAGFQHTNNSAPYGIVITYGSYSPNNTSSNFIYATDTTRLRFGVKSNGGIENFSGNNSNLCDEREKKNIVSLETKWDKVKNWELRKFHYNEDADTDDLRYGVIAQEVEIENPELITDFTKQRAEDAVLDEDGSVVTPAKEEILRKGVKEQQMMWMAIKALQEAMAKIETLEAKVAALEAG